MNAGEKLEIQRCLKGGASVSGVCRKHDISPTLFYEWENKNPATPWRPSHPSNLRHDAFKQLQS